MRILRKYMLLVWVLIFFTACSSTSVNEPEAKTVDLNKKAGGGRGMSYTLNADETGSTEKTSWYWHSADSELLKDLEMSIRASFSDSALKLSDETGLYLSDYPVVSYNLYLNDTDIYVKKYYLFDKEMEQKGYVHVLFENGKYSSYNIGWSNDGYVDILKSDPDSKYISVNAEYKTWALSPLGELSESYSIDPDARLTVGDGVYEKLSSLGLGESYGDITDGDRLIWISSL